MEKYIYQHHLHINIMLERVYYIPIYDISIRFSIYKFKKNIAYNYYIYT